MVRFGGVGYGRRAKPKPSGERERKPKSGKLKRER